MTDELVSIPVDDDEGNEPVPTEAGLDATTALIEEVRASTNTALGKAAAASQAAAAAIRDKDMGEPS